jgi:hypothetical protein
VNSEDYQSYAILRGYNVSRQSPGNGLILDEGRLSDMINHALSLPDREYHGLTIEFEGRYLTKQDMEQMAKRPDFPKASDGHY